MKKHKYSFRVRYGETDKMGVVYHGNYAQYLELGRTEWLRNMGISYKWMEDNGVMLPVVNLNINFKKPARYDDDLIVETIIKKIPTYRIEFYYEIKNKKGDILVTAETTLVFINMETNKLMKAPEYLIGKLKE